jgi:hypothetical protein
MAVSRSAWPKPLASAGVWSGLSPWPTRPDALPQERIWITNEIIHNPSVNDHLREMDVLFIDVDHGVKDFSGVAQAMW